MSAKGQRERFASQAPSERPYADVFNNNLSDLTTSGEVRRRARGEVAEATLRRFRQELRKNILRRQQKKSDSS